jgi:hypothetical protein
MADVISTFIIRLWTVQEPGANQSPRGRGRIDHVQSGEHVYFDQLAEGLDFLRRRFGAYDSLQTPAGFAPRHASTARDRDIEQQAEEKDGW